MAKELNRSISWLGLLLILLKLPSIAFAHRLDEYLQATLVAIEPGEIQLQINLTPGVAVARQILDLIDRDHDGVISTNEAIAYCEALKHDLIVKLDKRGVPLRLSSWNFPEPKELQSGWGIIQIQFDAGVGPLAASPHKLTLKNLHLPALSVYLFNAAQPKSGSIQISGQKRNRNQSTGEIEFTVDRSPKFFRRSRPDHNDLRALRRCSRRR